MKLLCNRTEFESAASTDYLPLRCLSCDSEFKRRKSTVVSAMYYIVGIDDKAKKTLDYCSPSCSGTNHRTPHYQENKSCLECGKTFLADRETASYCSALCQRKAISHISCKRSKAEMLLEELIRADFTELTLFLNDRDFLKTGLEIDLFLPEIDVALEVNGPGHYKPIYGRASLMRTRRNDERKKEELLRKGVKLYVLDISSPGHSTWKKSRSRIKKFYKDTLKGLIKEAQEAKKDSALEAEV